jgi:Holliday junction resolvase RusA-like endonuclease
MDPATSWGPPVVEFTVRGIPVAQGSARAFIAGKVPKARAIVVTDGSRVNSPIGAWRAAIRTEAQRAMGDRDPFIGPVYLRLTFTLPRPKAHLRSGGVLVKPTAPTWHSGSRGDLDKFTRAAFDALTGVCFGDDGQVASLEASKIYGSKPGVTVAVTELR